MPTCGNKLPDQAHDHYLRVSMRTAQMCPLLARGWPTTRTHAPVPERQNSVNCRLTLLMGVVSDGTVILSTLFTLPHAQARILFVIADLPMAMNR